MKRIIIILGLVLVSVFGITLTHVNSQESQEASITTSTQTTEEGTFWFDNQSYTYTSYEDLLEQIYADVSDDLTAQISEEIANNLTEQYYESIYDQVEENVSSILTEDEIKVYLGAFQNQLYEVIDGAETSVLGIINNEIGGSSSMGSGVIYKYDSENDLYYLITNYHVIEDNQSVEIRFVDESTLPATVLGYDEEVDIAILTFNGSSVDNLTVATLGDSDLNEEGEFVLAIGNPQGFSFYNSVTLGVISGLDRVVTSDDYTGYIQHDAAINGGNSGGPLFNLNGEVIGINVAKFATVEVEGMGFTIPINLVKSIIERIENDDFEYHTIKPRVNATYVFFKESSLLSGGVYVSNFEVNQELFSRILIPVPDGVSQGMILKSIDADSTFDGFLSVGDLIYQIGTHQLTDEESFYDYLYENYESGDSVTVSYYEYIPNQNDYFSTPKQATVTFK